MGKLRVYWLKTLKKLSICPLGNTPSAPSVTLAIRSHTLVKGSCSPPLLFAEASHTHRERLHRYASTSFPTVCDASLRPPTFAIFPSTRPSSSYPSSPPACYRALLPRVSRCLFAIYRDLLLPFPTTCHRTTKAPDTFYSPIWPHTALCRDSGSSSWNPRPAWFGDKTPARLKATSHSANTCPGTDTSESR